jgi:hypothetical protein
MQPLSHGSQLDENQSDTVRASESVESSSKNMRSSEGADSVSGSVKDIAKNMNFGFLG